MLRRSGPLRAGAAALATVGALLWSAGGVLAAGSADLFPNGASGNRANTEWRNSSYGAGAVSRRTLIHVYATAGEVVLVGSTGVGQGAADIDIWNPGVVTGPPGGETVPAGASYNCQAQRTASGIAAQGEITSRAQELAGPDTVPGGGVVNGYTPCYYLAPSTGIYSVAVVGPSGFSNNVNAAVAADVALSSANDFNASQNGSVAAWDVTVRDNLTSAASTHTGRVFTYGLALFTGGNGLPVNATTYPVTLDGFRYQIDDRGLDPNGWVQYGNQLGFLDPDGTTPLYHDAVALNQGAPAQLTNIEAGVVFAQPVYPVFLEPPDPVAITALGIPLAPVLPVISAVSFSGTQSGSTSFYQTGGTFHYTSNVAGVYEIVVSRDGVDFDPTNNQNRVLRGLAAMGAVSISWDGRDNSAAFFPPNPSGQHYLFKARVHSGEYHFPFIDVENDVPGGPTITMLNPPSGVCPPLTGGCHGAFYDDRGYMASNGQSVGTPGTVLCGNLPPATPNSDTVAGFDTTTTQRGFGTASGGNTNVPCTGSFGDAKGLDLWTFYPSSQAANQLQIVRPADIAVTNTVSNPTPNVGSNVTLTITVSNNGPADATGVQVTIPLPPGLTYVTSNAPPGTTYDPNTGILTIGPLANGGTVTLTITVTVTTTTPITVTASKTAEDQADPNLANDKASSKVTGQAPGGSGTVPSTGSTDENMAALSLIVIGVMCLAAGMRRRSDRGPRTSSTGH